MPVRSYRDLLVWQRSMDLAVEVYRLSKSLPEEERFGLRAQARKAAVSVPSNIAEGKGRFHVKEFIHHPGISNGSLKELETQLFVMVRLGYLKREEIAVAIRESDEIGKMLRGLRTGLERSRGK